MNDRPRAREKERRKLIRKYGYAGYFTKFVLPVKKGENIIEGDLIRRRDVLKIIEDIKCDSSIPKNYGTLLDIMRKIRTLPAVDTLEKQDYSIKERKEKGAKYGTEND